MGGQFDCLQPMLSKTEREICKAYGGWTNFMISMGLKPWVDEDAEEGKAIIAAFARDKEEEAAEEANGTSSGKTSSQ